MDNSISRVQITDVRQGHVCTTEDEVAHEAAVVVTLGGETCRFYCIPVDLEAMIVGYLKSRGLDRSTHEINRLSETEFTVRGPREEGGAGGREPGARCTSSRRLEFQEVFSAVEIVSRRGAVHHRTGCTHTIGIFGEGSAVAEDISRHCAIDKAVGLAVRKGMRLEECFMVTSCRQTYSTIAKAVGCGVPIVVSMAAVSDAAIEEAERCGMTLVGFASPERFNVYSHGWRLRL